ncbi:hypothetical protein DOP62_14335 (plasmid) [Synechococcus elongatus PCC 11801]|uniref:Uncharacterized protein n=1 Tax=Synechococcus elongatus PCC 11801 TaxID=2219813 RepID=A0ACD5A326_SYNEL
MSDRIEQLLERNAEALDTLTSLLSTQERRLQTIERLAVASEDRLQNLEREAADFRQWMRTSTERQEAMLLQLARRVDRLENNKD